MTFRFNSLLGGAAMAAVLAAALPAAAQQIQALPTQDRGIPAGYVGEFGTMWTFDAPPLEYWQGRYGFDATQEWLDHLRLSAVRLPGCSASFVSANGLVMTNHHCARSCIAAVSPPETNYLRTGFVAPTLADEKVCPGTYVDQLLAIEDVTERIRSRVTATASAEQVAQREAAMTEVREACEARSGLRCQVVAFYSGGMYSLYTYKRYEDLRLVMAPELEAAHFGGDHDNFTYPRYGLDVSFLRAYDAAGVPVQPEHFLTWSRAGAGEGEVVFVVGNPGSTGRLLTLAQMEYLRDVSYPASIADLEGRLDIFRTLAARDAETARRYENTILGAENSLKATAGYLTGLLDEGIMARKRAFEADFQARVAASPELQSRYGRTWSTIADAQLELATFATPQRHYAMGGSTLAGQALAIVRLAAQAALPEAQRLAAYQGAGLDRARQALLRDQAVDMEMERMQLAAWLERARQELPAGDPLVTALLAGREPEAAARALLAESRLGDVAYRRELLEGGRAALDASTDPFVAAARKVEPTGTSYLKRAAELNTTISANVERLGQAIYAAYGKALPPDATFTLRISDGVVKGFPMNGTIAPYKTSFMGAFARATEFDHRAPFQLAESWRTRQNELDLTTPFNFVATADIIGGNSGSPVVNRAGEVVGLVFDGNIEMLPNRFIFTDEVSRSVSVHSMAIMEALRKIYGAGHIADEITRR